MESFRGLQRFKKLDQGLRKFLPIMTPWLLVPVGFEIFAAFLRGCAENSLEDVLLFVVLPVAGWIIFSQYCSTVFFGPTTAPSLVAALLTTMAGTYFSSIFSAMSHFYNAAFGVLGVSLAFMFWRMVKSDPGRLIPDISRESIPHYQDRSYNDKLRLVAQRTVRYTDSEWLLPSSTAFVEGKSLLRLKHCRHCNVQVERYDHHCPAIYNCVGRKNHVLFLVMMMNFIIVEVLYVGASEVYLLANLSSSEPNTRLDDALEPGRFVGLCQTSLVDSHLERGIENWTWSKAIDETLRGKPWVFCTALFTFVHILWQVPFLGFHIYCACVNLTTDEMFHWEDYVDLHVETPPEPGRPYGGKEFLNPYCNGMKNNLASFLRSWLK